MDEATDIHLIRLSAAELVHDALMQLIVSGALRAGQPLRENILSQRLGVSRNSLREGIRLLEQSRLVKYEVNRGAIVSAPTIADVTDLYRTRLHLELIATQIDVTEEQKLGLRSALKELEQSTDTTEASKIVAADLRVHQVIIDLLGSERISAFYAQIRKELIFATTVISYADQEYMNPKETIFGGHAAIVNAICEGRSMEAASLLTAHIDQSAKRIIEILQSRVEQPIRATS